MDKSRGFLAGLGDSGGPLLVWNGAENIQTGVFSCIIWHSNKTKQLDKLVAYYTNLKSPEYRTWIQRISGIKVS